MADPTQQDDNGPKANMASTSKPRMETYDAKSNRTTAWKARTRRYMTLETIATMGDDPLTSLLPVAAA